jgi:hypothetical protein
VLFAAAVACAWASAPAAEAAVVGDAGTAGVPDVGDSVDGVTCPEGAAGVAGVVDCAGGEVVSLFSQPTTKIPQTIAPLSKVVILMVVPFPPLCSKAAVF